LLEASTPTRVSPPLRSFFRTGARTAGTFPHRHDRSLGSWPDARVDVASQPAFFALETRRYHGVVYFHPASRRFAFRQLGGGSGGGFRSARTQETRRTPFLRKDKETRDRASHALPRRSYAARISLVAGTTSALSIFSSTVLLVIRNATTSSFVEPEILRSRTRPNLSKSPTVEIFNFIALPCLGKNFPDISASGRG
jgi:hypothetical protein